MYLAQRRGVNAAHVHRAGVTLGLDHENARPPDHDVVDVAVPGGRVVDHAPLGRRQPIEQLANVLLGARPAVAPVDEREHDARDRKHAHEQRLRGREEAVIVQAQPATHQRRCDRQRAEHEQRAHTKTAHRRACVLPRGVVPHRVISVLVGHFAHTYAFIGVVARVLNQRAGVPALTRTLRAMTGGCARGCGLHLRAHGRGFAR